jgi:phosphatidylserine/phosphatidylglycerophosphate/cardiolipin synthase-like enzyme
MGASGVTPLTIVSHSSDIVQHYADLILNAEREIFFTTNIWEASESSRQVANAIRELSRRVVERGGDKIVIKLSE